MQLEPSTMKPAITRLKRARGQLDAVIRMTEEGQDCRDIITQLAAVAKAIDRAGYTIIARGMRECLSADPTGESLDTEALEKMFLSLS